MDERSGLKALLLYNNSVLESVKAVSVVLTNRIRNTAQCREVRLFYEDISVRIGKLAIRTRNARSALTVTQEVTCFKACSARAIFVTLEFRNGPTCRLPSHSAGACCEVQQHPTRTMTPPLALALP